MNGSLPPTLETARLRLRAHRADDLAASAAMWADPEVTRFIGGTPSTRQKTWMRMLGYAGHWSLLGFGYWAVEDRMTGLLIGEVGFANFEREFEPSIAGIPELGWAFTTRVRGGGIATEAALAALAWRDRFLDGGRTVAIVAPENFASIRVALKCGFEETARTTYAGSPIVLFSR